MEFAFSDEQQLLATTVDAVVRDLLGPATARRALDGDRVDADVAWAAIVDAGWTGLLVPAEAGGAGASLVEACIVAERLSTGLAPVPFAGSAIVAAAGLVRLGGPGADAALSAIAEGIPYSLAVGVDLDWPASTGEGCAWDWIPGAQVVTALADGLGASSDVVVAPTESIDLLHPVARLSGLRGSTAPTAAQRAFRAVTHIAAAAMATGAAAGSLAMAVEHARTREQFGKPIGAFQAVQHLCADMLVDVEASRSVLYGAAWAVEQMDPLRGAWTAAVAKAWCSAAAVRVCERAVQVLGGMGITWECDAHLHLRTAHFAAASFGTGRAVLAEVGRGVLERSTVGANEWI